jgi:hypothetical protein
MIGGGSLDTAIVYDCVVGVIVTGMIVRPSESLSKITDFSLFTTPVHKIKVKLYSAGTS